MFGAIASLLGSGISSIAQGANARSRMRFDKEENRQTRNWNLMLAEKQNQWNIDQWDRENTYNRPANQMQRFAQAGLNPDLIYGQSNLSAGSPALTSGAPATPTPSDGYAMLPTWSGLADSFNHGRLIDAQIKNINADTNKKTGESEGINIDNVYKALRNEQDLKLGELTISLNKGDLKLKDLNVQEITENLKNLVAMRDKIKLEAQEINSRLLSMEQDRREQLLNNAVDRAFKESQTKQSSAAADKLANDLKLQKEQFDSLVTIAAKQALGLDYDSELKRLDAKERGCYEKYFSEIATKQAHIVIDQNNILLNHVAGDKTGLGQFIYDVLTNVSRIVGSARGHSIPPIQPVSLPGK